MGRHEAKRAFSAGTAACLAAIHRSSLFDPHMDLGAKNESVILGFFLSTLPAVDVYGHRALQFFGWPSGSSPRVATDAPLGVSDASSNAAAPQCDISG